MAAAPKMDLKLFILPAMLLLSKKVDLTDPDILYIVKVGFVTGEKIPVIEITTLMVRI